MGAMTRRDALRLTAAGGLAALASAGCMGDTGSDRSSGGSEASRSAALPTPSSLPSRRELAALAAVPDGGALDVSSAAGDPAYLIRNGDSIRALSATCTHARCTVGWEASSRQFRCPCHRGTYDDQGQVISGPPPGALRELRVVVDDGVVYLDQ
jgi:Rieske Fe-S protein